MFFTFHLGMQKLIDHIFGFTGIEIGFMLVQYLLNEIYILNEYSVLSKFKCNANTIGIFIWINSNAGLALKSY